MESRRCLSKARTAYMLSMVFLVGIGVPSLAYLGFVLASRPPHSGIAADVVIALVGFLAGVSVGSTCSVLRRRWRSEFVGQIARVGNISGGSMARVVVAGVPYMVFIKERVRKGDRVVLIGTRIDGVPVRADFLARKVEDSPMDARRAQAR
jgi:hypothetical protein